MFPLTMIVLPKNSGFQIGEMLLDGMYGPTNSSKTARVSG